MQGPQALARTMPPTSLRICACSGERGWGGVSGRLAGTPGHRPLCTRLWQPRPLAEGWWGAGARRAGTHITVPLNSGADLLRARGDGELGLALEPMGQRLLGHGCGAAHVFVAGVGTAADQTWCVVGGGTDRQEESDQSSPPDRKRSTPGQGFTHSAPNTEKLEATYLAVCPLSPDT